MSLPAARAYAAGMAKPFPLHPAQPHRVCWGCDRYCAAGDMRCGNDSVRTPHPAELFGPDWDAPWPATAVVPASPGAGGSG